MGTKLTRIRFAQIEPTTSCDLSCIFCAGRRLKKDDITTEQFIAILDVLPDLECLEMQGEGEPLLHPAFFEMAGLARDRGLHVYTISNGNSLDKSRAERLIDSGINSIYFSVDTVRPDIYTWLRGGSLERVLQNIRVLLELKKKLNRSGPSIGFAITVFKETVQDLEQILRLYSDFGLDGGLIFQPLQKMESYTMNYPRELFTQIPTRETLSWVEQSLAENPVIKTIAQNRSKYQTFYSMLTGNFKMSRFGCPWLTRGIYISCQGHVLPCCKVKDTENYSFGVFGKTALDEIVDKRLRQNRELLNGKIPIFCKGCTTAEKIHSYV